MTKADEIKQILQDLLDLISENPELADRIALTIRIK